MSMPAPASAQPQRDRVQFETLLSDLSARLIAVAPDQLDETIESAMEALRRFFRVDRCGLLAVSDDLQTAFVAYSAYGEGVHRVSGDIELTRLLPWVSHKLLVDRVPVILSDVEDAPADATVDRATWKVMGTRSIFDIPIEVAPGRLHVIALHTTGRRHQWPREYAPRLRIFGEVLVSALERARASVRIREQAAWLSTAIDAAGLGFAALRLGGKGPYLDDHLRDLLGVGSEEPEGVWKFWVTRVHSASRLAVIESRRKLLAGEIDRAAFEYRYDHPERGEIWLRHSSLLTDGKDGSNTRLIDAVEDVTERRQALEEVQRLRERLESENVGLREAARNASGSTRVEGRSDAIRRTLSMAERVAATDSTVLLLGETGSGKERFATHIHECSRRHERPMIRVNCSAIPKALMESELFGREKGAYTGALSKQIGRFELANGSTLFLDEIAELPFDVQAKLLRVLEEHTIERLGNPRPVSVDVRIVAATNRDLTRAVREGFFREDLYYRLNVFPITVPSLRDRQDDIPLLVQSFVDEFCGTMGKRIEEIDAASVKALVSYPWPGNVRELRNFVERAMILASGPLLQIPIPEIDPGAPVPPSDLSAIERAHILKVLQDAGWRIRGTRGAAARLGLKPTTLESRIKKLGLSRPGA